MSEKNPSGVEKDLEHWNLAAILQKGRRAIEGIRAEDEESEEDSST